MWSLILTKLNNSYSRFLSTSLIINLIHVLSNISTCAIINKREKRCNTFYSALIIILSSKKNDNFNFISYVWNLSTAKMAMIMWRMILAIFLTCWIWTELRLQWYNRRLSRLSSWIRRALLETWSYTHSEKPDGNKENPK